MLDIGGTRGALVVMMPSELDGAEVELRRVGAPWNGTHTAVRRRDLRDSRCFAAVFGSIDAGAYQLRRCGAASDPVLEVEVAAGAVAQAAWPPSASTPG
jgi:hypothetical protein